jgi:hypothetical protein
MIDKRITFVREMSSMSKIDVYETEVLPKLGPLTDDRAVFPVPALALGGSMNVDSLDTGDARVHVEILLQMALG